MIRPVDNRQQVPDALKQLDLGKLAGVPADDAREVVERAGGQVRITAPDGYVFADFRADRVTLVVENGLVVEAWGLS
jgi:hypothetical protein